MSPLSDSDSGPSRFLTTAWSVVASAQDKDSEDYRRSLEKLCHTYWKPIYRYTRRRGFNHETALDLTQDYFAVFLEKSFVESADRERGRFRTFMLTTLTRFLSRQYKKQKRHTKGHVPLEVQFDDSDELRVRDELADDYTPEDAFNRSWARSLIDRALLRMTEECTEGMQPLYCKVFACYIDSATDSEPKTYREIGHLHGITESDVTNYLHRGRNIFQRLLREEVRDSVLSEDEIDDEINDLRRFFA